MGDTGSQRVLVVEDEPSISDVCRRVLLTEGFIVEIANNGKEAQKVIEKQAYDLCLIDIRTPAMNGMELFYWLKERHPALTGGVVFTTGGLVEGETKRFLDGAGCLFLPKPFSPEELRSVIRQAAARLGAAD